jgi:putative ABC transport system ATP-binding protein
MMMLKNSEQSKPVLKIQNLSYVVDGTPLLEDINLEVLSGDILVIVGPSGSGKTSLLRLINRLDEPTTGTILVNSRDYQEIPPRELRRQMGMVMQSPHLFPGTVADNIRFGPQQHGEFIPDDGIEKILDEVGLPNYSDVNVTRLSVGEAQRVALARTLANSPQVLLLDEPTSALDPDSRDDVEKLVMRIIRQQELTCLIVTHDHLQALRMGTRAMVIEQGRIKRTGPVEEVVHVN